MKKASLISIGTELLVGQTVDTNSAWIGQQLNRCGIWLSSKITVGDKAKDICKALDFVREEGDYIFVTGGLGPTSDDITKAVVAEYLGETEFIVDELSLERIRHFFAVRGRTMNKVHEGQASIPKNASPIPNDVGTATGMWFRLGKQHVFLLPGVPSEMKHMMTHHVLDKIVADQPYQVTHKVVMTYGKGESDIADMLKGFEQKLPTDVSLAYLPHQQLLRLRLTSIYSKQSATSCLVMLENLHREMSSILSPFVVAVEDISLGELLGKALIETNKTIATAESCTGGFLAHKITSVAGASAYFKGSIISYANEIKTQFLEVKKEDLEHHGAVSETVAVQMAKSLRQKFATDYAIALSGIMGPTGGTQNKTVGLVYMAIAAQGKEYVQMKQFHYDRIRNIEETANAAMVFLWTILKHEM